MRTILLMGLRGSGKSTCGAALAQELGRAFVDLDRLTLTRLGAQTVREAWEREGGEAAFRAAELESLGEAIAGWPGAVIALGGGTPTVDGFEAASADALRVYLHAPPAALRERFDDADADRPAMLGASAVGEIDEVYAARDGVYRGLAHETVSAEGTARDVLAVLRSAVDQAARE